MKTTTFANRLLFVVAVAATGAIAGAFVWLFFFAMNKGLHFIWVTVPDALHFAFFPLVVCTIGGVVIGLYEKRFGAYPEELDVVMKRVKETGRCEYHDIGVSSVAALLPLLFGGSVGPGAGLTGAIAGLCTWVGDRMKRFGADFKQLTAAGTMAALSAIFTAPLFGFAAPLYGSCDQAEGDEEELVLPKKSKTIAYLCAIAGALGAFMLLGGMFGGGGGLPRFTDISIGTRELAWLVPLALIGTAAGWLYHLFDFLAQRAAGALGERPVLKATIAGIILAAFGMILPFTMFAGESQAEMLQESWESIGAFVLIATGFCKVFATPLCIRFGWRGGHFFPVIFAGIAIGYGMAALTGADPVFCLCVTTAGVCGAVMRQPLMAALLLSLCFPVRGVIIMLAAAAIGSAVPVPRAFDVKSTRRSVRRDKDDSARSTTSPKESVHR